MPAPLRADVVTHIQRNTISQVAWFKGKDLSFVADAVMNLKHCIFHVSDLFVGPWAYGPGSGEAS